MTESELILLAEVKSICKKDSSFLAYVINFGISGISESEQEMRQMAADMETMASAMCFLAGQNRVSPQLKKRMSELAISKLEKYNFKTFCNWSHEIVKNDEGGQE